MGIVSIKNKTKSGSLLVGNTGYDPAKFQSIATATGDGSTGTMTFSSIPSTYAHLQLRISALATTASGTGGYIRFNGDTASNYSYHYLIGYSSTAAVGAASTQTTMQVLINNAIGLHNTSPNVAITDILDYASTSKYKTLRNIEGVDNNTNGDMAITSGLWQSTSAINSITFYLGSGAFATTTKVALYGIKAD